MTTTDFTTSLLVDKAPEEVFNAITNMKGWWSEEIIGEPGHLNETITYHYENVHRCQFKLVEAIPAKRLVWLVTENYFSFIQDTSDWVGTKFVFDLEEKNGQTQIRFTHEGLVPEYECYDICESAWTKYIQESLRDLILTGKGHPNASDRPQTEDEKRLAANTRKDFTVTIQVKATPEEAFHRINEVSNWWTKNITGRTQQLHDEFVVQFGDVHRSTQRIIEFVPARKVVWLVTDSQLNFLRHKSEWTATKIYFDIKEEGDHTIIQFTHQGLTPDIECYDACSKAWTDYMTDSLRSYINTGKGHLFLD